MLLKLMSKHFVLHNLIKKVMCGILNERIIILWTKTAFSSETINGMPRKKFLGAPLTGLTQWHAGLTMCRSVMSEKMKNTK